MRRSAMAGRKGPARCAQGDNREEPHGVAQPLPSWQRLPESNDLARLRFLNPRSVLGEGKLACERRRGLLHLAYPFLRASRASNPTGSLKPSQGFSKNHSSSFLDQFPLPPCPSQRDSVEKR